MTVAKPYSYASQLIAGGINWSGSTVKCALFGNSFVYDRTHFLLSNLTGEISSSGYTAGGMTLSSKSETYDSSIGVTFFKAGSPVWSSITAVVRAAVFYIDGGTGLTRYLLTCMDFEAGQSVTAQAFTVVIPDNGVFYIQAA